MIKHIVAWNYKQGISQEQNFTNAQTIKAELENLANLIPQIVSIRVITELEKTSNRDIVLISLFEDEQALSEYQANPDHLKVSEFISTVMQDRICLDYLK